MARNRQRAKERQARRKAQQGGAGEGAKAPQPAEPAQPAESHDDDAALAAGAPPQDVGRSDEVLEYEQDLDAEHETDQEHFDPAKDHTDDSDVLFPKDTKKGGRRPRFVEFLVAVWAELKRVEWPDRQQLITLTGVVLGFCLIAGGYLGLLDAVAQRIVNAII